MKKIKYFIFLAIIALGCYSANAQESAIQWYDMGAYQFTGGLSLGYRNASIGATDNSTDLYATQRYYEMYNLRSGISVSDVNFFGQRKKDQKGFFDEMYLNASGINDPFTTVGLRLRSFNQYDFKINFKDSKYYMNRPDSLWSDLHKYDYSRQMLTSSLSFNILSNLGLELDYSGVGRSGNEVITNSTYFYGVTGNDFKENNGTKTGTSNYGSLSTGNFYWMNTPRNDWSNDIGGKLNLKLDNINTNIVVGGGYRSFSQDVTYTPYSLQSLYYYAGSGMGTATPSFQANANGIVGGNPRNESLYQYSWEDKRISKTPYYFGQIASKITPWLSLNADVRYESNAATSTNAGLEEGKMRKISSWYDSTAKATVYGVLLKDSANLQNYYGTTMGTADMKFKRLNTSILLTFKITNQLQLTTKYKYTSDDEETSSNIMLQTSLNPDVNSHTYSNYHYDTTMSNVKYTKKTQVISPQLVYSPFGNLNLRAGVTMINQTPSYNLDTIMNGIVPRSLYNTNLSKQTSTVSPTFSVFYKPLDMLSLRARFELTDNSSKYDLSTLANALSGQYLGQKYGGTAPQYDLITPDTKQSLNLSTDIKITDDLSVLIGYQMTNSKGNLQPWYDYYNSNLAPAATPLRLTGDLNMKTSTSAVNCNILYNIDENSAVRLSGQFSNNKWSIPFTGTSKQSNTPGDTATNPFNDLTTTLIDQNITDVNLDASIFYSGIENLNITLGVSLLNSTGGDVLAQNLFASTKAGVPSGSKAANAPITSLPITNPVPDQPWVGGPYSKMELHARAQYQFMKNLGLALDWMYVKFDEKKQDSYVGLTSFTANLIKISLMYRL